ncbi:hypothetical protein T484DRAFT_1793424 [Baffinella frigidus]|nr:hypothetical protein T484DRAFT_1793424 [Cryptophyta sp. CCMP2293]
MTTREAQQDDAADGLRSPQPRALKLVWHGLFSPSGRKVPPSLPVLARRKERKRSDIGKAWAGEGRFHLHDELHPGHEDAQHVAKDAPKLAVRLERRVASRRALPRNKLWSTVQTTSVEKENSVQSDVDWLGEVLRRPAQPGFHMIPIAPHLIRKLRRLSIDSPQFRRLSIAPEDIRGPGGSRGPARSSKTSATVAAAAAKKLRTAASAIRRSVAILRDAQLFQRSASEGEAQTPERRCTAALPLRASSGPELLSSSKKLPTFRVEGFGFLANLRDARLLQRSDSEGDAHAHTPERTEPRAARNSLIPAYASLPAILQRTRTPSLHDHHMALGIVLL